jgi:hypothetical protein
VTGSGTVTNTSNFALNVSNANDTVSFRSAQRGRFITGLTHNASIGVDRRVFDWEPDGTF